MLLFYLAGTRITIYAIRMLIMAIAASNATLIE